MRWTSLQVSVASKLLVRSLLLIVELKFCTYKDKRNITSSVFHSPFCTAESSAKEPKHGLEEHKGFE